MAIFRFICLLIISPENIIGKITISVTAIVLICWMPGIRLKLLVCIAIKSLWTLIVQIHLAPLTHWRQRVSIPKQLENFKPNSIDQILSFYIGIKHDIHTEDSTSRHYRHDTIAMHTIYLKYIFKLLLYATGITHKLHYFGFFAL